MLDRWGTNAWFSVALVAVFFASMMGRNGLMPAETNEDVQAAPEAVYFEDMISALAHADEELVELDHAPSLSADRVQTVEVDGLVNGNDETSQLLEETMMAQEQTIRTLREVIRTRAELLLALHESAFEVDRVVALDVRDDGSIVVFCK